MISGKVDLVELQKKVEQGLLSCRAHPEFPLFIFNYTPKVQYERLWDELTLSCRGLITDAAGVVVARPFQKFFNLEELLPNQIPTGGFEVFEKMDGSLGILYWADSVPRIATRGSFESLQAQFATKLLHEKYGSILSSLDSSLTYLFEIIYPENRIVVDYGDRKDLVLLAVIETATGQEKELADIGFPVVNRYDGLTDFAVLKALEVKNAEGFVVKFPSGFRFKVKFADYVRLHRILTGVSNLAIWEYLYEGKSFDELLTMVPDEFYNWVKLTIGQLQTQYRDIEQSCQEYFRILPTRKESALYYQQHKYPAVLFKMLDNQPYDSIIWKSIRPKYAKAFAVDEN